LTGTGAVGNINELARSSQAHHRWLRTDLNADLNAGLNA
jgi:hypothetical protein